MFIYSLRNLFNCSKLTSSIFANCLVSIEYLFTQEHIHRWRWDRLIHYHEGSLLRHTIHNTTPSPSCYPVCPNKTKIVKERETERESWRQRQRRTDLATQQDNCVCVRLAYWFSSPTIALIHPDTHVWACTHTFTPTDLPTHTHTDTQRLWVLQHTVLIAPITV